jgi:ABC-2 type transport system permease protein
MGRLLASEIFRLRKRLVPYVLLGLLAFIVALLYVLLWLIIRLDADAEEEVAELEELLSLEHVLGGGLELAFMVAGVMAVILGALLISSEYGWGTIRTILPRSAGRDAFIGAKLTVVAAFCFVLALVSLLSTAIMATIISLIADLDRSIGASFVPDAVFAVVRMTIALAPFGALGFMLALLTRSAAAGIGVGLAVFFLEDPISMLLGATGGIGEEMADLLIMTNVLALMNANQAEPDPEMFNAWRGAATILAYVAIFAAVSFWRFRTRDVTVGG